MQKLAAQPETDATILAAAGLDRLGIRLSGPACCAAAACPRDLAACVFEPELMLPCVGQGAIGLEIRDDDERMAEICRRLDHYEHLPMRGRRTLLSPRHGRRLSNPHWRLRLPSPAADSFARRGALDRKCPARRGQERLSEAVALGKKSPRSCGTTSLE